jgi:hypothetical protein
MKRFIVTIRETHTFNVLVDAADADEARIKAPDVLDEERRRAGGVEANSVDTDMEDWDVEEQQP